MWETVLAFLETYRNRTIYIGCSGGVDSMTLLETLRIHGFSLHVLHVNYHKRGQDSIDDQLFIERHCVQHNIPFSAIDFPTSTKGNFQNNARAFRYDFFEKMRQQTNGVVALGHHLDDQIETFCMHLMRKSGVMGLASIPQINGHVIRPFLSLSKSEIRQHAISNNISWREDTSNLENQYLRNKWRLDFLPFMEKTNPDIRTHISTLIQAFQETQKELEKAVSPLLETIIETQQIAISTLKNSSTESLFELWRQLEQPTHTFLRFEQIFNYSAGKHIECTGKLNTISVYNATLLFDFETQKNNTPTLTQCIVATLPTSYSKNELFLNTAKITGPLNVRPWEEGDKIASIGMHGKQLVSKIIKDAKIPLQQRKHIFVLHDNTEILWVLGLKIGGKSLAQSGDASILKISFTL